MSISKPNRATFLAPPLHRIPFGVEYNRYRILYPALTDHHQSGKAGEWIVWGAFPTRERRDRAYELDLASHGEVYRLVRQTGDGPLYPEDL